MKRNTRKILTSLALVVGFSLTSVNAMASFSDPSLDETPLIIYSDREDLLNHNSTIDDIETYEFQYIDEIPIQFSTIEELSDVSKNCLVIKTKENSNVIKEEIEEPVKTVVEEVVTTPTTTSFSYHCSAKTYGDYRCVSAPGSKSYDLLYNTQVHVCDDGMLRDDEGYICAALGSYFGQVGSRWVFVLDNGKEIPVIKCDGKPDCATDANNVCGVVNYDIIEFYVDTTKFTKEANGLVYWGNFDHAEEYNGAVVSWYKVDTWYN